jgi:hypothetical protein
VGRHADGQRTAPAADGCTVPVLNFLVRRAVRVWRKGSQAAPGYVTDFAPGTSPISTSWVTIR